MLIYTHIFLLFQSNILRKNLKNPKKTLEAGFYWVGFLCQPWFDQSYILENVFLFTVFR